MRERNGRIRLALGLCLTIALAAGLAAAAEPKIKLIAAGLNYESLSRTVVWTGDTSPSKIGANIFSARADLGLGKGLVVSFSAGLSLTAYKALVFDTLPISLQFDGATISGLFLGAEAFAPILKFSDFELGGTGRFVYVLGLSKTWPLEDFAVEGEARGKPGWMEAAAGPRLSYLFSDRIVPYFELCVRWLRADFRMTETLGDLSGTERKLVQGDLSFSAALGADAALSDRISVKAKAGILPYAGGVDGLFSIGFLYRF
jgi:hypothetical protein